MKLNETIRARRRERGLTQEQVAQALGVSTPAVNKWERGICCPDITLLPPLARLLGVDLNTLLSFQEDLTPQEIGAISNQICEQIQAQGFAAGYETAMEKLREFPSCGLLCYQLAAVLRGALFLYAPEQTEAFQPKLDALFERAAQSEEREVREAALRFLRLLRERGCRDIHYLKVLEHKHGDARFHFHVVLRGVGVTAPAIRAAWGNTYGHAVVSRLRPWDVPGLAKYLSKEVPDLVNKRSYSRSRLPNQLADPVITREWVPDDYQLVVPWGCRVIERMPLCENVYGSVSALSWLTPAAWRR